MAVPSLLDLRMRRDLSNAWNEGVLNLYEWARKYAL